LLLGTAKMAGPPGTTQQHGEFERFYKMYGSGLKRN